MHLLPDLALLVGVAIPIVALAHRLKAPPIVGFLAAGVLLGPSGLSLIEAREEVTLLAELGVALLLFAVGLELSLSHVRQWARRVLLGGGLQVAGTTALVAGLARLAGVPAESAIFYGALAALSSTAIVTRAYADRAELDTGTGRSVLSVLIFQDLCVLPLILLLPVLSNAGAGLEAAAWDLGRGLLVMAVLVIAGRFLVRPFLDRIVLLRDRELFTLCIGFVGIAAALVTETAGFSIAIGAFIAGLIVSESEYGAQALADVLPFRAMFSGIFFISIGMLLDLEALAREPLMLAALLLAVLLLKALVTTGSILAAGQSPVTAVASGVSLAQVGEFSMVLAAAGLPLGLFADGDYQRFLAVAVLSMTLTPFLIAAARPIAERLVRTGEALGQPADEEATPLSDHTIVVGYGLAGRYLARALHAAGIRTMCVTRDANRLRRARKDGIAVTFGDGAEAVVLEHAGIRRARLVVFTLDSPTDDRRGVATVRDLNPSAQIAVCTRDADIAPELGALGADHVIAEEFETSIELFAKALESYRIPVHRIWRETEAIRTEHYGLLRGTASPDLRLDALKDLGVHGALELVEIPENARVTGMTATTLDLRQRTGVVQVAVVRDGQPIYRRTPAYRYRPGDTVVLVGDRESLDEAILLFRQTGDEPPPPWRRSA